MATIEQVPPGVTPSPSVEVSSPLNNLLARAYAIDWITVYYVAIFIAAVLTRFIGLGDRVMSHDESLHTKFSWDLYKGNGYAHTPLMHGPILFHMTALSYFLFGDNDFSARLYPAILGIIMVLMPMLLFQRWLGKRGAMVSSFLLLISPMVLFHNRYIREDTPSIFFTLLMVYAIFAFIDGVRPRQTRWLILLSGATLASLGSKEVGFIYVAIFGLALTIFWLAQLVQGLRSGETDPQIGWIVGLIIGAIAILGVSFVVGSVLSGKLAPDGNAFLTIGIVIATAIILSVIAIVLIRPIRRLLGDIGDRANSMFKLVMAGIIIGVVGALLMTIILNIDKPSDIVTSNPPPAAVSQSGQAAPAAAPVATVDQALLNRFILWTTLAVGILALIVVIPALIRYASSSRLPWLDFAIVFGIAAVVTIVLAILEERSQIPKDTVPPPGHDEWIYATWGISLIVIIGILFLRFRTSFFKEMRRYPAFDVMIVLGTLILPWLAALPVFLAGYQLDANAYGADTITASIKAVVPLAAISIAAGLSWDPTAWLLCAGTFYAMFVFFYTTIFTNMNGLATGLVGSLGYWLAQQGVRRGSQPQYFYFLQLGVYEYLPVIGAIAAGIAGLSGMWLFRRERMTAAHEAAQLRAEQEAAAMQQVTTTDVIMTNETTGEVAEITQVEIVEVTPAQMSEMETPPGEVPAIPETGPVQPLSESMEMAQPVVERPRRPIAEVERLERFPFLPFVGFWAVFIIMALTMAGEKMPWMTTHLTVPLIFLTGWYVGMLMDKVDWQTFWKQSWSLILLTPILIIALANVIGLWLGTGRPFAGIQYDDLLHTFTWFGAVLVTGLVGYAIYKVWQRIGRTQVLRVGILAAFVFLAVITARVAWRAAYIDYDDPTEFMVYAHGAPENKIMMQEIDEISKRTTDGNNIKVAYDNSMSWPGEWYFRNYPNRRFLGDPSGATDLDQYVVIAVGEGNNSKVQAQLQDNYVSIRAPRLWWPMQDYFDMTVARVDNIFAGDDNLPQGWISGSKLRQGLWDIWWNRDYTAYGDATGKDFKLSNWPVTDWMILYVRKDVASLIWDLGTGAKVTAPTAADPFAQLRCTTCMATTMLPIDNDTAGAMNHPRGMSVGPDGNLYVADSLNARIAVFGPDGKFIKAIGSASPADQNAAAPSGTFREPWGVAVGKDGTIYVADTWNHRIQVFDQNGTFKTMWGHNEITPGQPGSSDGFFGPRDIAVDANNNIYVADTGNKRIRVYSLNAQGQAQLVRDIGQAGSGEGGTLNEPVGLAISNQNNELYVADSWNKRIQVFDLNGVWKRSWPIQGWASSSQDTGSRPYLALDKSETHLFVTVPDLGRVLVFDTAGGAVVSVGQLGSAPFTANNQFAGLGGITVDPAQHLFVADAASGRIARFDYTTFPGLTNPVVVSSGGNQQPGQPPSATPPDF